MDMKNKERGAYIPTLETLVRISSKDILTKTKSMKSLISMYKVVKSEKKCLSKNLTSCKP